MLFQCVAHSEPESMESRINRAVKITSNVYFPRYIRRHGQCISDEGRKIARIPESGKRIYYLDGTDTFRINVEIFLIEIRLIFITVSSYYLCRQTIFFKYNGKYNPSSASMCVYVDR